MPLWIHITEDWESFFLNQLLFTILTLTVTLIGCDTNLKVVSSGIPAAATESGFLLLNEETITNEDPSLAWKVDEQANIDLSKGIELILAKDSACQQPSIRLPGVLETQYVLKVIDDGQYYYCAFAFTKTGSRVGAINNGVSIFVDRKSPQIDFPATHQADGPTQLNPAVMDLTTVTYDWKLTKGPGSLAIDPNNAKDTLLTFSAEGLYEIAFTATDAAGNQTIKTFLVTYKKPPLIVSLEKSGVANDGYVNDAEKSDHQPVWVLQASNYTSIQYSAPLAATTLCDANISYTRSTISNASELPAPDGAYVICAKIADSTGDTQYAKSQSIIRDTVAPNFMNLIKTNEAFDGYVNDSEKNTNHALWQLSANDYDQARYTIPLDHSSPATCNASLTYNQTSIATALSVGSDGSWVICAKLSDQAGNVTFGKSEVILRDTVLPTITSFNGVNEGVDGYISSSEVNATNPLWQLLASDFTAVEYTVSMDDSTPVTCHALLTYDQSSVPRSIDLGSDKPWIVCAKISDAAGNTVFQKSMVLARVANGPLFTSLAPANEGSDGYVNDAEKMAANPLWTLNAAGHVSALYTIPLDNSASVTCDSSQTYNQNNIATAANLPSDKPWVICVELKDVAANITYGKSAVITRDTSLPVFTSLNAQNEANDGYVNNTEKTGTLPLWVLSANGHNSVMYTAALDETSPQTCDTAKTYDQATIAAAADLPNQEKSFSLCVRLRDAAGNITYGKSQVITRDTVAPTFTSLTKTNEASDGYINIVEKNTNNPLWTLSAGPYDSIMYSSPIDHSSPVDCSAATYDQPSILSAAGLTTDGVWVICAKLTDTAGNNTYGQSEPVERDIVAPTFTSLSRTNEGFDGYINDTEKNTTHALWQLGATDYNTVAYTIALDETFPQTCDNGQVYNQSSILTASGFLADGPWVICVKLSDNAGNATYGKSATITRDTGYPVFTSLNGTNEGSDGYVSAAESAATNPLWTLVASGGSSTLYTAPLDDTSSVTCDSSKTYDKPNPARAVDLSADKPWVICVELADVAGNITYGKSSVVTRNTGAPTFTSLVKAHEGVDGYVNDSEKNATNPLWILSASGQSSTKYTIALDNSSAVSCDNSQTYNQNGIPAASDLASDKPWVICVELKDVAGNITYGKSEVVTRDVGAPIFTSLNRQNEGSDGYVNNSEKTATHSLCGCFPPVATPLLLIRPLWMKPRRKHVMATKPTVPRPLLQPMIFPISKKFL